jgi:2',3'-cyclic-nucleotide 2'-phosphodiesterase (5'-nucleotidase family)/Ca2+-binding EF-hand superfamily protein
MEKRDQEPTRKGGDADRGGRVDITNQTAHLRIINVTDIYKLDNFPSLKTVLDVKKAELEGLGRQISILTGDFLAPYLLSALDKGTGMVNMLNTTPIDYVIFGNHEDDIEHKFVCQRIAEYKGTWINTNMQSHEMFEKYQKAFDIITVTSPDGSNSKRIGLIGVLSNTPALYRKNAFGGAVIEDPYEAMAKYKRILEEEHKVDLVIPLCHLYEPQDEVTCARFDFPIILSGHDHHTVDRMVDKTRLLKAGADANYAIVLDISWGPDPSVPPSIESRHVNVLDYPPDQELQERVRKSYSILDHLRKTEVCVIPERFRPFTSVGSRSHRCTAATFLWSALRDAFNANDKADHHPTVDCVLLAGGDLRGGKEYPADSYFSLEDLKSEIQEQYQAVIVEIPGDVLEKGIMSSHVGSNPGWIQYDDKVEIDEDAGRIIRIGGQPFDRERFYRIATSRWDICEEDSAKPAWFEYFKQHPEAIPPPDHEWPVFAILLSYFANHVWKQVWKSLDVNHDGKISPEELRAIDTDGDSRISKQELAIAMQKLGFEVDPEEIGFVDCIMHVAGDDNNDGYLSLDELNSHTPNLEE